MENNSVRNHLHGQRTTAVPQFRRYLGGPTDHSKRPTSRPLQPPPQPEPEERTNPRQLLRSAQNRVADFWRSWMKYFAPNLLPRNKWFRVRDNIQIGDLVLELDPKHKRCEWKMARIVGTYPGNDGLVRKVRIKTRDGEYDRPIHKLCLIATQDELNADCSS